VLQPEKHEPHIRFGKPRGTLWNTFTYWLAEYVLIYKSILGYGKPFLKEKQWTLSAQRIRKFFREELSIQYSVAETLFPRPDYWPERAQMIGFRERSKLPHFPVEKGLIDFLKIAPNPIYISFGSMVNARPKQIGEDLLSIAKKHNLSFIINTSWGGIELPESIPDGVYCVSDVPYDYLFPKVLAVLHHGGSGTTHSAWICGKSQAIIPHLGDQFLWNRCLNTQGIGISGFPIKEWTYAKAEALLLQLREHAIHKGEKRHVKG
jgi:UDP:flavonoid glycosyltransferase YjiC (YdhE family)